MRATSPRVEQPCVIEARGWLLRGDFLFRHALAAIPFTGAPFFPADLSLGPADILLVAIGVPAAAATAARVALRCAQAARAVGPRACGVKMNWPVWSRWIRQPPSWTARW
jgi:hypothetical protein